VVYIIDDCNAHFMNIFDIYLKSYLEIFINVYLKTFQLMDQISLEKSNDI